MITAEDLKAICPTTKLSTLALYVEPLNDAMREFNIDTPEREAMFLAQIAHESGGFHYVKELASGQAYEGRSDLGNASVGDGVRYKGRGLIQITGRANYQACGDALGCDLIDSPDRLCDPDMAARSAGWFWGTHGLNDLADRGDFLRVTKRINGGSNGYAERLQYLNRAQRVLSS